MSKQNSSKTKPLSEAHIQATCTAWLALDGWRCIRTDLPRLRGLGVQERGMPDNLYIRYWTVAARGKWHTMADVLWIEWKKKGRKAAEHQRAWHATEREHGAMVLIAGENFPASIEGFCIWYAQSGLQRKPIGIPR
jgi:hypothetical protein